jgi:tetraacyldisaccharide 4'-kinase
LKTYRLPIPVISIGNLSVGGTGKTPVTLALAEALQQQPFARRPAVLSRGYRRTGKGFFLVSDGRKVHGTYREAGDEPLLIAQRLKGVVVAVDADRVRGGNRLIEIGSTDILLLDDGFQHRRIARDLDIVLLDAESDLRGRLLPAGNLREPLAALRRADLIALARLNPEKIESRRLWNACVGLFGAQRLLAFQMKIRGCRRLRDGKAIPPQELKGMTLIPFCGIAKPRTFLKSLEALGAHIPFLIRFSDHHRYHAADVERLAVAYNRIKPDFLVTTEKDAVKLGGLFEALPILVLEIEIEWVQGEENLLRELHRVAGGFRAEA